jgi:phage terminase large subunit
MKLRLDIKTPRWSLPLLKPMRYKAVKGGRGSGKSHFFAEAAVESMILNPDKQIVCIREVQKSLKFSVKKLVEQKLDQLKVAPLFHVTDREIRRRGSKGLMIFQGMQDHTADSIKSLEGFDIAWVEEAQNLSERSLTLLRPTLRAPGSELWFGWNPEQPEDAVENLLCSEHPPQNSVVLHVNYDDNPFFPEELRLEMEHDRRFNPDSFDHVWKGAYNKKTKAQILSGKWRVDVFEVRNNWDGPYYGLDFGFAHDPTAGVEVWVDNDANVLYIRREAGKVGLELDDTPTFLKGRLPRIEKHVVRADSARPESISYLKRKGIPRVEAVKKGPNSVEDGIEFLKSFREIVVHEDCEETARECRLYSYKVDKGSGDVLPLVVDEFNHYIDATRYALEPIMRNSDRMKRFLALSN